MEMTNHDAYSSRICDRQWCGCVVWTLGKSPRRQQRTWTHEHSSSNKLPHNKSSCLFTYNSDSSMYNCWRQLVCAHYYVPVATVEPQLSITAAERVKHIDRRPRLATMWSYHNIESICGSWEQSSLEKVERPSVTHIHRQRWPLTSELKANAPW